MSSPTELAHLSAPCNRRTCGRSRRGSAWWVAAADAWRPADQRGDDEVVEPPDSRRLGYWLAVSRAVYF